MTRGLARLVRAALVTVGGAGFVVACSSSTSPAGASGSGADASADGPFASVEAGGAVDATGGGSDAPAAADAPGPSADAAVGCGAFVGDPDFTCSADGNSRAKCVGDASLDEEACPNGCLREPAGTDSVCMGTSPDWSCTGSYGTTPAADGDYYMSEFGCWQDDAGVHTDPDDNCIPSCLAKAQAAGLCDPNGTGADCEEKLDWYVADGARFGCLQRLRVTNPANGKALIAIALDYGPACSGEAKVQRAVLDSSGVVNDYLFGSEQGASDMSLVHVVEVDDSYALGPIP